MSRPPIQSFDLTENINVCECHPDSERRSINWWLWDTRAKCNVAMGAKTKEAALVEAIDYWAERYLKLSREHAALQAMVDRIVEAIRPKED